jgi:hypothetical protein
VEVGQAVDVEWGGRCWRGGESRRGGRGGRGCAKGRGGGDVRGGEEGCDVVPVLVAGCSSLLQPTVGRDSGCQPHPHSLRRAGDIIWAAEVRG